MKKRIAFVSNSSSSSFIILSLDGSEEVESGMDACPNDFDLYQDSFGYCYSTNIIDENKIIELAREKAKINKEIIEEDADSDMSCWDALIYLDPYGDGDIPDELSPFNNLEVPTHHCLYDYLLYKYGENPKTLLKEMKEKFGTWKNFQKIREIKED